MRLSFALCLLALTVSAQAQGRCALENMSDDALRLCRQGTADAIAHLERGSPQWHWWGIPDHTTPVVDSLLQVRYGLDPVFHGDIVWDGEDHYTDAYNTVVLDRFAPRFGSDFVARLYEEAAGYFPGGEWLNPEVVRDVMPPAGECIGVERCSVIVSFNIAPSGVPTDLEVRRTPSAALSAPALEAAGRLRFRPATIAEGGRWLMSYTVPVRFVRR